jgi:hypothetical protein
MGECSPSLCRQQLRRLADGPTPSHCWPGGRSRRFHREAFQSEAEIAGLPGVRRIDTYNVAFGPRPEVYAFARETVQRNL